MSIALQTAQRAFDTVQFYQSFYLTRPNTDDDVKFLSYVDYSRFFRLDECIVSTNGILGAVPSYRRLSRNLPLTPVESAEEWSARLHRLEAALVNLGIVIDKQPTFLILSDDETGPFCCDLSSGLGWLRCQASVSYVGEENEIGDLVAGFAPDIVIVASPRILPAASGLRQRTIVVRHVNGSDNDVACDRLLVCDEIHVIGSARAGTEDYKYRSGDLHVETDPRTGYSAITTPNFTCFPLVRYSLGRGFRFNPW